MMKPKYRIGDVVHFEKGDLTAVIKARDESVYWIEYIHNYTRRVYSDLHTIRWLDKTSFKIDI